MPFLDDEFVADEIAITVSGLLMAQVALTLLEEDVQLDGGIYTSACLGQGLIDRAAKAGFKIETELIS